MGQISAMYNNGSGVFSVIMAEFISPLIMKEYILVCKEYHYFKLDSVQIYINKKNITSFSPHKAMKPDVSFFFFVSDSSRSFIN